jgi:hypothetical protein
VGLAGALKACVVPPLLLLTLLLKGQSVAPQSRSVRQHPPPWEAGQALKSEEQGKVL